MSNTCFLGLGPLSPVSQRTSCMDPAPALRTKGRAVHRQRLYYEAFDAPTWAWQQFIGVAKAPWEEASDLHRSSLLAWHADFIDQSYRHLRDMCPGLYDAVMPEADTNPPHSCKGHRPQLKARQGRLPHQLSNSNQAPHQVHPQPQLCPGQAREPGSRRPPQSVLDQAAADRAASKAIVVEGTTCTSSTSARAAAQRAASVPRSIQTA